MKIAVTGANGFIGSELCRYLEAHGHTVSRFQRTASGSIGAVVPFDLSKTAISGLEGLDTLVHTAFAAFTASSKNAYATNVEGTLRLEEACLKAGVKFVFLSSMSAHEQALSRYGKHKLELEQRLNPETDLILRPGLVIGDAGLFSRIKKSVLNSPFQVVIDGGTQPLQIVAIEDLVRVIEKCIVEKRTGIYTIASKEVYTMRELILQIAGQNTRRARFISIPYSLISAGIKMVELFGLPLAVSSENLLGLKQLQAENTAADLDALGVRLMDLNEAISIDI